MILGMDAMGAWFMTLWLALGFASAHFKLWAWGLQFEMGRLTIGSVFIIAIGAVLPPLSLCLGVLWLSMWAFSDYNTMRHYARVKWPPAWTRFRYRQHCTWGRIWYLGSPTAGENCLSGWSDFDPRSLGDR